jgi:hypothetical protein
MMLPMTKNFSDNSYLFLLLFLILISGQVSAQLSWNPSGTSGPVIIDTKGYTYGQLNKISRERSFNDAIVGEVLLGHGGSSAFVSFGNQPPDLVTNPWRFCIDEDHYEELEKLIGRYVVLIHKTPKQSSLLSCSAANELVEIYPVDDYQPFDLTQIEGSKVTLSPEISSGVESGIITNVIKSRQINRHYFLTVQLGGSGSQFRHFVINDPDLFDFAIESLKMAVKLRLHYVDRLSRRNNVKSLVWKMEMIE